MEIINTTVQDAKTVYKMTKGAGVTKMKTRVGECLPISQYIKYIDRNSAGEEKEVLSIAFEDGTVSATASPTFIQDFDDILAIMGGDARGETIRICEKESKAERKFICCEWV